MEASTFGTRLRQARESRGLTQEKLARDVDVTSSTIYKLERDRNANPTASTVLALASRLDVSLDWLLRGVGRGPRTRKAAA